MRKFFDRWRTTVIPVVFVCAAFLRFVALDADPPGTADLHFISDEGWWVHNARNKVLFDQWVMDDFNQSLLASPPFCFATYGMFSLFGVSYGSSRLIPVLSGLITVLLFAGLMHKYSPPPSTSLAFLLFGCNFGFLTMNRTAYVDSTALLFLVLSWWLMERLPHRVWAVFLSGMSFALAVVTKSYVMTVLPPVLVIMLLRIRNPQHRFSLKTALLNLALFAGGIFAVYLLWRKYLFIPFERDYTLMYSLWQDGNFPASVREALRNIPTFFFNHKGTRLIPACFLGMNATLILLAAYRIITLLNPAAGSLRNAWKKMPRLDRECLLFLTLISLQIAPMIAKPFRRYLLLYIPLLFLASRSILPTGQESTGKTSDSKLLIIIRYIIPCSIGTVLIAPYIIRFLPAAFSEIQSLIIVSAGLCPMIAAGFYFFDRAFRRKNLPIAIALAVFIAIDGGYIAYSMAHRTYTLRDTSRRLGQEYLTSGTIVLGGIAGSLCLENQALPITIWGRQEAPRVFNQDPIRRFSPDFLIVLRKLDGLDWVRESRYDRYIIKENYLQTLELLPDGDGYRIIAELYKAPQQEPESNRNPRLAI